MKKVVPVLLVILSSCAPKSDLRQIEWKKGQEQEALKPLISLELSKENKISSAGQSVLLLSQEYDGVFIENSFVKKVRNRSGEDILVRAAVSLEEEKLSKLKISDFLKNKNQFQRDLPAAFPIFKKFKPDSVDVVIAHRRGFYEPLWKVVYADNRGVSWEVRLNNHLQVQGVKRVGSQFHDTLALVFPLGPKKSNLQEVLFKNLQSEPTISNERLLVSSQASSKILNLSEPLKFDPQDARFDQVQVFFFLEESLGWFERKLKFGIPWKIHAEVHVGAPEKTNSAFYYQGKIRIGSGDGETYSRIPQDPSIVIHESVHALVDAVARLPFEGEGGSVNEGFADFFTAAQLNNPNMGDVAYLKGPFRRSVVNDVKLSEKTGGLYHDSAMVSGVLWDLKEKFGTESAILVAMLTLNRLVPSSDLSNFGTTLKEVCSEYFVNQIQAQAARDIVSKRGF